MECVLFSDMTLGTKRQNMHYMLHKLTHNSESIVLHKNMIFSYILNMRYQNVVLMV